MNYEIIQDQQSLEEFIDWLPDTLPNEQYFVSLMARKKYDNPSDPSGLTTDKSQLKSFTSTKERLIEKLRQLECEFGCYRFKDKPIPQNNLAVYITPNPRDLKRAGINLLKELANKIASDDSTYNPKSLALSCIQTTSTRKIYFDVDIDLNNPQPYSLFESIQLRREIKEKLEMVINKDCLTFIRTRGGMHCLIELEKIHNEFKKNWYNKINNLTKPPEEHYKDNRYNVTMNSDNLLPLVGCIQGNYIPSFLQ